MEHYRKLLLGMVATLTLFASTTPVFASTGGTLAKHRDFNTGVSSTATVEKSTTQATAPVTVQQQKVLTYGWNVLNGGDPNSIVFATDKSGTKATGWSNATGSWRYFNNDGTMIRSKWIKDGANWYYLDAKGTMLVNCNVDGYHVNKAGAWDSNAVGGATTYSNTVVDKTISGGGSVVLTTAEFESKIQSGKIKAKVDYYRAKDGSSTGVNTGTLTFYLAN